MCDAAVLDRRPHRLDKGTWYFDHRRMAAVQFQQDTVGDQVMELLSGGRRYYTVFNARDDVCGHINCWHGLAHVGFFEDL